MITTPFRMNMTGRLIIAIATTVFQETVIVAIILWGLPQLGIYIPVGGLIAIMFIWAANAVFFYLIGSQALRRKPVAGLGNMGGNKGKVVRPLDPDGLSRIGDEFWEAKSVSGQMTIGEWVNVVE